MLLSVELQRGNLWFPTRQLAQKPLLEVIWIAIKEEAFLQQRLPRLISPSAAPVAIPSERNHLACPPVQATGLAGMGHVVGSGRSGLPAWRRDSDAGGAHRSRKPSSARRLISDPAAATAAPSGSLDPRNQVGGFYAGTSQHAHALTSALLHSGAHRSGDTGAVHGTRT